MNTIKTRLIALINMAIAQFPFLQSDVKPNDTFVLQLGEGQEEEHQRTLEYLTVTNQFAKVADDQSGLQEISQETSQQHPLPDTGTPPEVPPVEADPLPKGKLIECRILQDCEHGSINTIVQLTNAKLKAAKALGLVCNDPASVDYARSLNNA
jgi:hypothetical protein